MVRSAADRGTPRCHVRIWLREGRFMPHHLAGGHYSTVIGENSLKWAVPEHGDEIVIGPHRIRFETKGKAEG
jgi:hypothetical protein